MKIQCSTTCGVGYQEMQFTCVGKSKLAKELAAFSSYTESATSIDSSIEEEDSLHANAAFALSPRKKSEGKNNLRKNLDCGAKPSLSRACINSECLLANATDGRAAKDCKDLSAHCNLTILQRYCALPHFRMSCCQSCANYLAS